VSGDHPISFLAYLEGFMLKFFISSASRRKVLVYFLENQAKEYHLREISRNIGEPAPAIKRELDKLEQIGFLLSWTVGNRRYFKVNPQHFLLNELKAFVDKAIDFSASPKVLQRFTLKEAMEKRKIWQKRSKAITELYGKELKRQRPRHPAEKRLLERLA
jgi:predicted transcriptional regulator